MFDKTKKYGKVSIFFHWIRVILLILIYGIVYTADYGFISFRMHMVLGIILFMLLVLNIFWRFFNAYPESIAKSTVERNMQMVIFILIYVILFTGMLMGYLGLVAPINVLGIKIPVLYNSGVFNYVVESYLGLEKDVFITVLRAFHKLMLQWLLMVLIILHIVASFYNIFVRKNKEHKRIM